MYNTSTHYRFGKSTPIFTAFALTLLLLLATSQFAFAANPPEPTYGTATVDGDITDWDLDEDWFADMLRAQGQGGQTDVLSKLYVRYDLSSGTLYVLVLVEPGYAGLKQNGEAWVKIDGDKAVDGALDSKFGNPQFAWIEAGYDGNSNHVKGYEASFLLPQGEYTLNVHLNVQGATGGSDTSGVLKAGIDLFILPETLIGTTLIAVIGAAAVFYVVKRSKTK